MTPAPMRVRGTGLDLDTARKLAKLRGSVQSEIIEPPLKWSGRKARPFYISPMREAHARAGKPMLVDPFMGAGTFGLNLSPGDKALLSDFDPMLVGSLNAMKDKNMALDWSRLKDEEGFIGPRAFFEDLRGGVPRSRGGTHFSNVFPPKKGTLNDFLSRWDDLSPDEELQAIRLWMMYQNLATAGNPRMSGMGLANNTFNWTPPGVQLEDEWDYSHYAPLMENFDIRHANAFDLLQDLSLIDPDSQFLTIDPPYLGEPGAYGPGGFSLSNTEQLADILGGLAGDGMPIVAFNSRHASPIFADQGFDVFHNLRTEKFRNKPFAVEKPEMIALANIDMTEDDWFRNFPQNRWQYDDLEPRKIVKSEQMSLDAFDQAWSLIR